MIKLVLVSALVASSIAAILPPFRRYPTSPTVLPVLPSPTYSPQVGRVIAILRLDNEIAPDSSSYRFAYDTENGISAQESGNLVGSGPDAAIAASGSYQYTSPEGVPVQISYIADQNGFQPSGNVLPTPPPIPEAILRSLEYNAAHPESQTSLSARYYRR